MYPYGVQKAVRGLPQYQNLPFAKNSKMSATVIQGLAFIVVGVLLCLLLELIALSVHLCICISSL